MAIFCMLIGFIPAMVTAVTTESYLTFIDYASMTLGISIGGLILEWREAHGHN